MPEELWQQDPDAQVQVFYLYMGLLIGIIGGILVSAIMGLVFIYIENTWTLTILLLLLILICLIVIISMGQEISDSIRHARAVVTKAKELEHEVKDVAGEDQPPAA